jgi:hypothetical protein
MLSLLEDPPLQQPPLQVGHVTESDASEFTQRLQS